MTVGPCVVSNRKTLVQQRQKVAAQLGGHGGAVGWVEPDDLAPAAPPPCISPHSSGLRLFLVADPPEVLSASTYGPLAALKISLLEERSDNRLPISIHTYIYAYSLCCHVFIDV